MPGTKRDTIIMTDALVRRNLATFSKYQADVAVTLQAIKQPESVLERDADGTPCNIRIGSERLYAGPAKEWAAGQIKGFLADNQRIIFTNTMHCNVVGNATPFPSRVIDYCQKLVKGPVSGAPVVDVGYVFVFGVGLGYHIEELLLKTPARNFILIEPITEFLLHSLSAVDWSKLYRLAKKHGKKLYFISGSNPDGLVRRIEKCMQRIGSDFIDGSYIYFHYYSWYLTEAYSKFNLIIKHYLASSGFFDDEKKMMTNACMNMRRHDFHICEDSPFIHQSTPVFIVGSGPSLDNDLDYIRQWRNKIILISSGTALGILLQHGLRPDIHTEVENGNHVYPILARLHAQYGFEGIRLGASLTVTSDIGDLFDRRWFFLRGALSPARLLAGVHARLSGSDPTVSNASLAIAAMTGFKEIYLFGVDCGFREGSENEHHSQHSIYFTENKPIETSTLVKRYDRLLPGNFGGQIRSEWVFDMTSRSITEVKKLHPDTTIFNCSDGARLEGTQPRAAEAIDLSHLPDRHERVLEQIEQQMTYYQPGELLKKLNREQLVSGCQIFIDALVEAIAEARREKDGFWEFHQRVIGVYAKRSQECLGAINIVGPTLFNMMRLAAFYGVRIINPRHRRKYFNYVLDQLQETATVMINETAELLDTLLAEEPPAS